MVKASKKNSKSSKAKSKNTRLDKNKPTKKNVEDKKTTNKVDLTNKTKTIPKNNKIETQNNDKVNEKPVYNNKNDSEDKKVNKSNKKFKILDLLFNTNSTNKFLDVKDTDNFNGKDPNSKTNIAKTNKSVHVVKDTTVKLVENKELNEILNRFLKNLCQITEKILGNNLNYNEGYTILLKDVNLIKSSISSKLDRKSNLNGNHNSNKNSTITKLDPNDNKLVNEVINILYEKLLLIVIYICKYYNSGKYGSNSLIENITNLLYRLATHIFDEFILDSSDDDTEYTQNKLLLYIWDILLLLVNCKDKKLRKNFLHCLQVIVNNSCLDEIIINSKLYKKHIFNILSLIVSGTKPSGKESRDRDSELVLYKLLQSFQIKDVLNVFLTNLNNNTVSDVKTLIINIINITDNDVLTNIISRLNDNDVKVKAEVYRKLHPLFNDINANYVVHIFHNFLSHTSSLSNVSVLNKTGDKNLSDSDGNNEIELDQEFYNMLTNWIVNMDQSDTSTDGNTTDSTSNSNSNHKVNQGKEDTSGNTNKLVEFINHLLRNTLQLTPVLNVLVRYFQYLTNKYNGNNIRDEELVIYNEFTNSINSNNVLLYIYNSVQVDSQNKLEVDMGKLVNDLKTLVNSEDLKEENNSTYLVVNTTNVVLVLIHNHLTNSSNTTNGSNHKVNQGKEDTSGNTNENDLLSELETSLVKLIKLAPLKSIVIKLINEYIELTNLNFNHSLNNGYLLTNNLIYYVLLVLFSVNSNNSPSDNHRNGMKLENILNDIFDPHNISSIKKLRIDFNNVKLIRSIKEIDTFDFSNYSINQLIQFTNQINSKLKLYNNNNNILKNILKNSKDNNNLVNKELNENISLINKYKTLLNKINTELNGRYTAILLLVYVYFNLPNTGGDLGMMGVMDSSGNMYNISGTTSVGSLELVNRVYSKYILNVLRMYTGSGLDSNSNNTGSSDNSSNTNTIGGLEYYNNVLLLKILCVYNFVLFNSNYSDIGTVTSNIRNELNVYHVLFTNIVESIGSDRSTKTNKTLNDFGSKGNDVYVYKLEVVLKIMVDLLYLLAGPIPGGANGLASPSQSPPSNMFESPSQSPTSSPNSLGNTNAQTSKMVENIIKGVLDIFDGETVINNYIYSILIKLLPKILYVTINTGNSKLLSDYSTVIVELLIFYPPNPTSNTHSLDTTNSSFGNFGTNNVNNNSSGYSKGGRDSSLNDKEKEKLHINNYDLGILQSTLSYLYSNNVDIGNTLDRIITTTFHYYFNNLTGVSYVLSNIKYFLINLINLSTSSPNSLGNTSRTDRENKTNEDRKSVVSIIVNILVVLLKSNKYTNINELLLVINFIITKNFISVDRNNSYNGKSFDNDDTSSSSGSSRDGNANTTSNSSTTNDSNHKVNQQYLKDNRDNRNNLNSVYILLKYYHIKHIKHYKNNKLLLFILSQLNPNNTDTKLSQNEQSILTSILSTIKTTTKNEGSNKKPYCKYLFVNNTKTTTRVKRRKVMDMDMDTTSSSYDADSFLTDSEYYTDTTY